MDVSNTRPAVEAIALITEHKVPLQQAVKMTERSENTLLRDVKKGKVSAERDDR